MIVLDTNVLSALMLREPDPVVVAWLDRQDAATVWTTAITVFEVGMGIALLPTGRRRRQLEAAFGQTMTEALAGRILPFDREAAEIAGRLAAERQRRGRPVDLRDTQIAGVVLAHRATIATRNVRHFDGFGLNIVNPWG